jgi:hypothetical protein
MGRGSRRRKCLNEEILFAINQIIVATIVVCWLSIKNRHKKSDCSVSFRIDANASSTIAPHSSGRPIRHHIFVQRKRFVQRQNLQKKETTTANQTTKITFLTTFSFSSS